MSRVSAIAFISTVMMACGGTPVRESMTSAVSGAWTPTGSLGTTRSRHTATLLQNGRVLIAGGLNENSNCANVPLDSAELYDPATGSWAVTGSMTTARYKLQSGNILVAAGAANGITCVTGYTSTAELY